MAGETTSGLLEIQAVCLSPTHNYAVAPIPVGKQDTILSIGPRVKIQRERRKWSQADLANRVTGLLLAEGSSREIKQQSIDQLERCKLKSVPDWVRFIWKTFEEGDAENRAAPDLPGMLGEGKDPNERPDELTWVSSVPFRRRPQTSS